jgi:Bacteriophage tail sheath protein
MPPPVKSLGVRVTTTSTPTPIISGVATSIAAFVGRRLRGPVNTPTAVSSFAAFVQSFGGFWADRRLTYAVQDFFLNGGMESSISSWVLRRCSRRNSSC